LPNWTPVPGTNNYETTEYSRGRWVVAEQGDVVGPFHLEPHRSYVKRLFMALACLAPLVASGCGEAGCVMAAANGLVIAVRDVQTHASLNATVTVTDGTFSATKATNNGGVIPAPGRPGTYNITVTAVGYQDWTQNGVQVKSASCGQPESISVTADLQPKTSP
jgi:hypothetical protein